MGVVRVDVGTDLDEATPLEDGVRRLRETEQTRPVQQLEGGRVDWAGPGSRPDRS